MSDTSRGKGGESGRRDGGSVRRARERMEAGERGIQPMEDSDLARSSEATSRGSPSIRRVPPAPGAFKALDNSSNTAVISKPSPAQQWPLRDENARSTNDESASEEMVNFSKRPAPQRPARPDDIPSLFDSSKVRDTTPSIPYRQGQHSSSFQRLQNGQSMAQSPEQITKSADKASGSVHSGSPNAPPPSAKITQPTPAAALPPPRGNLNYHPPPSTRRAGPSYYSSTAFVSPIPEESPEITPRKGGSYASSKVIPSSWETAPPDSDIPRWSDEDFLLNDDDKPAETLVRQASLGKRGKASLRTINKTQSDHSVDSNQATKLATDKNANENVVTTPIAVAVSANSKVMKPAYESRNIPAKPEPRPSDDYASSSDDDYEKPPIPIMQFESKPSKPTLKKMEGQSSNVLPRDNEKRRPPQIDIDAVRQAEARGSLTSLPELIRRATKLASNLDRGKTASRLGISDFLNASDDRRGRNSSSISDILASFPPPAVVNPAGNDRWPGPFADNDPRSRSDAEEAPEKGVRRCCGFPLWVVILTCIIMLALISVAVIIPVALTALPQSPESVSAPLPPKNCQETHPCLNGGISVGNLSSCGCVCVDGFGGDRCAIAGDNSCTAINLSNDSFGFQNATLGASLVRLFEDSEANFSIPLDTSKILRLFNRENVSCTSQNALVIFNGASRKRDEQAISQPDAIHGRVANSPSPTIYRKSIRNRFTHNHRLSERQARNPDLQNPTQSSLPPWTAPTNSSPLPTNSPKLLDFSRIAVLFIFGETEDIVDAVNAHDSIQSFLQNPAGESDRRMWSLGVNCRSQDFILDFNRFTIRLDNGTIVGGT
ncbi:hypothetical protein, variant [Blastomyces dermatitidis ER-3]|uniref:EGF-like domain-containing protein n=1 Tax=Ajellomyces dermatitidis (strain ER-3 / ATCC MYA-2586) TaxID=559297 RepID=A0ABX2VX60_AJEDR|nr:uncharacterized protein BDCG_05921 [Blastomyces dermatitidis ER-3]XP_045281459.1 hypothetical protein, variant [Blastomyces dermatitidis ER-3]EEQ90801.1 hypothetical protein BDCG_05921 [Blastomyces dermatitidis ER-3]OAT01732.1 hypothetical protein, variant [Blastomyces dermatitidis ER-3]